MTFRQEENNKINTGRQQEDLFVEREYGRHNGEGTKFPTKRATTPFYSNQQNKPLSSSLNFRKNKISA